MHSFHSVQDLPDGYTGGVSTSSHHRYSSPRPPRSPEAECSGWSESWQPPAQPPLVFPHAQLASEQAQMFEIHSRIIEESYRLSTMHNCPLPLHRPLPDTPSTSAQFALPSTTQVDLLELAWLESDLQDDRSLILSCSTINDGEEVEPHASFPVPSHHSDLNHHQESGSSLVREYEKVREGVERGKRRSSSESSKKGFKCPHCPKRLLSEDLLAAHSDLCASSRGFGCAQCPKRFKNSAGLVQHTRTHTGQRRFGCDYCDKSFVQRSHLNQHRRIHTGEKPYVCSFCGKAFRQRSGQLSHEATHIR